MRYWDEERERHGLNQNPVYIGVHDFEASRAWQSYSLNSEVLVYAEGVHNILPRRHNRRYNARYHGQDQTQAHEDEGMQGMEMQERADAGGCFDDEGYERTKNIGDEDTDKSAGKTDERSFGNKDVAYIFFARSDCTKNTDFFCSFLNGNQSNDSNHNR